jgi:hypothetical protein
VWHETAAGNVLHGRRVLSRTWGTYWYQQVDAAMTSVAPRAKLMTLKVTAGKHAWGGQASRTAEGDDMWRHSFSDFTTLLCDAQAYQVSR